MASDPAPPRFLDADGNANARAPRHVRWGVAAVLDDERARNEIDQVIAERDTEGTGQVARAAAQIVGVDLPAGISPRLHKAETLDGSERANQHGGRMTF